MAKKFNPQKEASKQSYIELLLHPGWAHESKKSIAEALGLSTSTLTRYDKEIDWDWIRDERRKTYAAAVVQVDASVLRRAIGGDITAAKLAYERFDGYVPAQALNFSTKTDEELLAEAAKIRAEEDAKRAAQK